MKVFVRIIAFAIPFLILINLWRSLMASTVNEVTNISYISHKFLGENYVFYVQPATFREFVEHFSSYNAFPNINNTLTIIKVAGSKIMDMYEQGVSPIDVFQTLALILGAIVDFLVIPINLVLDLINNFIFFFEFFTGAGGYTVILLN